MKLLDQSAKTNWKFIAIIAFVAVFLAGGILMLIPQFQEQTPPLPQQNNSQIDTSGPPSNSVEGWQTYRNEKYGFELELPPGYALEGPDRDASSEYFLIRELTYVPDAYLTIYKAGSDVAWYGPVASGKDILINGISGKEIVFTSTDHFSGKESPCSLYEFTTSSYIYQFSGYEGCFNQFPTALKILATFRFVDSKEVSLSTNCIEPEGDPVITSISPDSGPVGTEVEIRGCHLTGFEGDLDAAFIRSDGAVIPLYGGSWCFWCEEKMQSQDIFMKVVVQSYCESGYEGGRYSGIISPCQKVEAMPGLYKVHVTAWGKKSNDVNFTITK